MRDKVVYCSRYDVKKVANELGDCYILTSDNWDDYTYKTYFHVTIYKDRDKYEKLSRKILFEDENTSSIILDKELELSTENFVTLEEIQEKHQYISLGHEYEELKKIFPENVEEILQVLNDVIYLDNNDPENELLKLKETEGFRDSLCRDQSAKKVLEEAKHILYKEELDRERLQFNFNFQLSKRSYNYHFNFVNNDLPHRINILVGKNGSGKTQTLLALSEYFSNRKLSIDKFNIKVDREPNFIENTMVFAYNPHEEFPIYKVKDYKYLGLRRNKKIEDIPFYNVLNIPNGFEIIKCIYEHNDLDNIKFSSMSDADIVIKNVKKYCNEFPLENIKQICMYINSERDKIILDDTNILETTFASFKGIYERDRNNFAHNIQLSEIPYRNKIIEFLNNAFDCDGIGLKFNTNHYQLYVDQQFEFIEDYIVLKSEAIHQNFVKDIDFDDFERKLYFTYDNKILHLSSGQQMFVDLVINLLSLIKTNSLILIDEPENTLHPNLEIDFMKILKDILEEFDSFAIIATHSSIIVREVSSTALNIIVSDKDEIEIQKPLLNTFGSNITDITNYIFNDIFENRPYTKWLHEKLKEYESFEEFQEEYQNILSYELMLEASDMKAKENV